MNIERALTIRNRLKVSIIDLYSCARMAGMTSGEIGEAKRKILADMPKGTPQWVRTYIDGYCDALNADLYANWLVFGGYVDGVFYSTHRNRDDYYSKHGIEPCAYADDGIVLERGHYWSDRVQYHGGIFTRNAVKAYFIG